MKRTFGITREMFDNMIIEQSGLCLICSKQMVKPCVDHDHACCDSKKSCGKCIRGLLCNNCNVGIASFRDDIATLGKAVDYLRDSSP